MVFDGVLPKCCPVCTKGFTSDAIKLSQKKEFLALRSFRFTLYIIVVSVISIAFVVVKLKISKKEPFLEGFCSRTPALWSNIAEILNSGTTTSK